MLFSHNFTYAYYRKNCFCKHFKLTLTSISFKRLFCSLYLYLNMIERSFQKSKLRIVSNPSQSSHDCIYSCYARVFYMIEIGYSCQKILTWYCFGVRLGWRRLKYATWRSRSSTGLLSHFSHDRNVILWFMLTGISFIWFLIIFTYISLCMHMHTVFVFDTSIYFTW